MSPAELAKQVEVVKIFAGKAAPAYAMAKAIIHLIVKVSEVINHDSSIQNKLKIVHTASAANKTVIQPKQNS